MKKESAVKALIVRDNRFLLLKQRVDNKVFYTLPGGRTESSDFGIDLKREVKEETGLDVEVEEYIGEWSFVRESDGTKTTCKTFLCKPLSKEVDFLCSDERERILEFVWVTKEEFLKCDYTHNETLLNLISKYNFQYCK